jgi:hypothetical protein
LVKYLKVFVLHKTKTKLNISITDADALHAITRIFRLARSATPIPLCASNRRRIPNIWSVDLSGWCGRVRGGYLKTSGLASFHTLKTRSDVVLQIRIACHPYVGYVETAFSQIRYLIGGEELLVEAVN